MIANKDIEIIDFMKDWLENNDFDQKKKRKRKRKPQEYLALLG